MDHIGIDVHKRDSQIYILAEGGSLKSSGILTLPSSRPSRRFFPCRTSGPSRATGLPAFAITNSSPSCARSRSREKCVFALCTLTVSILDQV
jgi:hypothetical protein